MSDQSISDKKRIQQLLQELNVFIEGLPESKSSIPAIESDLIKELLRKMYLEFLPGTFSVHTNSLTMEPAAKDTKHNPAVTSAEPVREVSHPETDVRKLFTPPLDHQPAEKSNHTAVADTFSNSVIEKNEGEIIAKLNDHLSGAKPPTDIAEVKEDKKMKYPATDSKAIENKTVEDRIQQIKTSALFEEPSTVANKYTANETLGDKITKARTEKSLGEKLQTQPLEDLKVCIGINERFAFINDLFGGNQQLYHDCIDQLNRLQVYEEAERIINENLLINGKPDFHQVRIKQFEDLIKRRFNK